MWPLVLAAVLADGGNGLNWVGYNDRYTPDPTLPRPPLTREHANSESSRHRQSVAKP